MTAALDELAGWHQWLYWKQEPPRAPGVKPVKMPYDPHTGKRASTTDSATWADFDTALSACQTFGGTGLGFVFAVDDPYCGVDLDGCIDTETGAVADWALTIVDALASYTELSPSGTGLHVIVRATLPAGGNRKGAIELYDRARYFTVTGQPYPGSPTGIAERQPTLEALHRHIFGTAEAMVSRAPAGPQRIEPVDADLIDRMLRASNGDRTRRLWEGDTSRYGGDDSAADFALLSHLHYWTGGDDARMDRLFRQSGLMREKWDEKRGQTTYGLYTLSRVCGSARGGNAA